MIKAEVASYGCWRSPITTDLITASIIGLGQIALCGEEIYWSELRPSESGRNVIVRRGANGEIQSLTPHLLSPTNKAMAAIVLISISDCDFGDRH